MADRTIQKAKGGVEDLLFGDGAVVQTRNATNVGITKINADKIPYSGDAATADVVTIKEKIDSNDVIALFNIDTIAELIVITSIVRVVKTKVQVSGFYAAGDGGGGTFVWDATGDKADHDGGTIIDPDIGVVPGATGWWTASTGTGIWKRVDTAIINPLWFGALNDGTLDIGAIQKAIDVTGHGHIHFPLGHYKVAGLTIDHSDNLSLQMSGDAIPLRANLKNGVYTNATVIEGTNTATSPFIFGDGGAVGGGTARQKVVSNMGFVGTTDSTIPLIDASFCPKAVYDKVFIYNHGDGDGILLESAWITSFYNCFIEKSTDNARTGTGVTITNSESIGGLFNFFNTTIYIWSKGVDAGEAANPPVHGAQNINFFGSQLKSNSNGIYLKGGIEGATFIGCYMEGNISRSIFAYYGAKSITVEGCYFAAGGAISEISLGQGGVNLEFGQASIKNNLFRKYVDNAIYVNADAGNAHGCVVIENNTFAEETATPTEAIKLAGEEVSVIRNNTHEDTTTYITNITKAMEYEDDGIHWHRNNFYEVQSGLDAAFTPTKRFTISAPTNGRPGTLPLIADTIGSTFEIYNDSITDKDLIINEHATDGGSTILRLQQDLGARFFNDGTEWKYYLISPQGNIQGTTRHATDATITLTNKSTRVQTQTATLTGNQNMVLPLLITAQGLDYLIVNSDGADNIVVVEHATDGGATIVTLTPGDQAHVWSDGITWFYIQ